MNSSGRPELLNEDYGEGWVLPDRRYTNQLAFMTAEQYQTFVSGGEIFMGGGIFLTDAQRKMPANR